MAEKFDVVNVGMINFDINVKTFDPNGLVNKVTDVDEISLALGGDAQNCAFTLSRLGMRTALVGAVGRDKAGEICVRAEREAGIDTSMICYKDVQTGTAIQLFQTSEAAVLNCSGANASFCLEDIPREFFGSAKIVSLNSFFGCGKIGAEFLRLAQNSGMLTLADTTSLVPGNSLRDIADALPYLDYFVPSYAEASALAGREDPREIAQFFLSMGVKNVAIKLGAQGCLIHSPLEEKIIRGYPVSPVVDTTGCGDNFVAAFLASLVKGYSLEECAKFDNAAGAINATRMGSNGAVQSFEQLIQFRKDRE